jgi:hypothetical protein
MKNKKHTLKKHAFTVSVIFIAIASTILLCIQSYDRPIECASTPQQPIGASSSLEITKKQKNSPMFSSDIEQRKKPHVIVTLCNAPYLAAAVELVRLLRTKGGYKDGDIVVLYWGEDIEPKNQPELMSMGVIMQDVLEVMPPCRGIISTDVQDKDNRQKRIRGSDAYYFKTAIFSSDYFGSRWERVLYMDSRMDIHRPSVMRFFDSIDSRGALMANPDSWPSQADNWKLSIQFWPDCNPSLYEKLRSKYFLDYEDYFQVSIRIFLHSCTVCTDDKFLCRPLLCCTTRPYCRTTHWGI